MSKKKLYNHLRTVDFEITTVVSVDVDSLGLRLNGMDPEQVKEKIEKAWAEFLKAASDEEPNEDLYNKAISSFYPGIIKSKQISDSLRVTSVESLDVEDGEDDQ